MQILLRAAIAIFSLGIGSALCGRWRRQLGDHAVHLDPKQAGCTRPPCRGSKILLFAAQNGGAAVQGPDTRSPGQGTWLFRVFSLP